MDEEEIRRRLDSVCGSGQSHAERIAVVVGLLSEPFRRRGLEVTVVGGSALELHAPGVYATLDIDVVIDGGTRDVIAEVFSVLGFTQQGRHWVRDDLFVDVVGRSMFDPVDVLDLGDLRIRVISKEVALADRVIGFKWWRYTEYGAQAVELLRALEESLDTRVLRDRLAEQQAEDALDALTRLLRSDAPITAGTLGALLRELHGEPPLPITENDE